LGLLAPAGTVVGPTRLAVLGGHRAMLR
jgi:hypothetical protein